MSVDDATREQDAQLAKALGEVIRELREGKELTRKQLAEDCGISLDMMAKIEQGARSPSPSTMRKLAARLDLEAPTLSARAHVLWAAKRSATVGPLQLAEIARGAVASANKRTNDVLDDLGAAVGPSALGETAAKLGMAATGLPFVGLGAAMSVGAAGLAQRALAKRGERSRALREQQLRQLLEARIAAARTEEDLVALAGAIVLAPTGDLQDVGGEHGSETGESEPGSDESAPGAAEPGQPR